MLESGILPSAAHVQVLRFDVENDDDVRDAVVTDDGGAASGPDAAPGDGGAEVDGR